MDENVAWQRVKILETAAERLRKNNFNVAVADNSYDACGKLLEIIKPDESVAFGGSQTVKSIGIEEKLESRGQQMILQKPGMSRDEVIETRRKGLSADVFVASPNAVTLSGELLFADKIGNRACGMVFGPKTAIAVCGWNKIVKDEAAALYRVRYLAGPANAKRLKLDTPCSITGICADCDSRSRICNIFTILKKKPAYTNYHVVLVKEDLGY